MSRAYFVTGTDTGVGKTFASCALLRAFAQQGQRSLGMKPIAAGCEIINGHLVSDDALQLLAAGNVVATPQDITPYAFAPPIAPHIAAQETGQIIEIASIVENLHILQKRADVVIVEGVGGFCVPINKQQTTADLAITLNLPVILVVGMRLGCLNHALLTAQAIRHCGLHLAGWIANNLPPDMPQLMNNILILEELLKSPLLATLAYTPAAQQAPTISLNLLP